MTLGSLSPYIGCPISSPSTGYYRQSLGGLYRVRGRGCFPSLYLFTIGHGRLLGLEDGPPFFNHTSPWCGLLYTVIEDSHARDF